MNRVPLVRPLYAAIGAAAAVLVAGSAFAWWPKVGSLFYKQDPVDFSRDIRPILNQNCTSCHGGVRQKNGVSFIYREEALGKGKSGRPTVVPGKPERSELIARVTATDPEARMPYHAPPLSAQQIDLLRRWIKEGAQWVDHWAFVPPKPQPLPAIKRSDWARQPLDRFILARLEKEGLKPSAEASKAALLRRMSFDLTGLPPTAQELATFLADTSPEAYEKQVDRLLASPQYGERWASLWLDLARYADSKGYEQDQERRVWPYRDWVIAAFNRNVPYDQFVITQLAGDLLPHGTLEDQIATAFHRQTPANDEGGTDDEEFRLVAVMDRVATTWSVLNGVTINCVQCHSHPYDPIRHEEYYKFLAFFNTSRDADLLNNSSPFAHVPKDKARYAEAAQLQQEITQLRAAVAEAGRQVAAAPAQWQRLPITAASANGALGFERRLAQLKKEAQNPIPEFAAFSSAKQRREIHTYIVNQTKEQLARLKAAGAPLTPLESHNGEVQARGTIPAEAIFELTAKTEAPVLTALRIEVLPVDAAKARHTPEDGFMIGRVDAWVVHPNGREEKIAFRTFVPDSEDELQAHVAHTRAESSGFGAERLFQTRWIVGIPTAPVDLAPGSRLKVQLTQTQDIYHIDKPGVVRRVRLFASGDPRWKVFAADSARAANIARLEELDRRLAKIPGVPLPVMEEQATYEQRQTLAFERGNFLTKTGAALTPDMPALFPKLPASAPRNRLTMAQWFFRPGQPLTARVAVNRFWEQLFGIGLVETLEDFGSVGEVPSHPELLDWLALHFQNDLHWDMKALLRELVLSATYRQSAKVTPALLEKDPRNRLLARGPLQRLAAEMVRDQALLASGLLSRTMGGPPVMPPQPEGVWMTVYNESKWIDATGPDRYRRAVYTYLKRSSPYPSYLTFDSSARDVSLARRLPTNTPLQALVTLNDPVYQEAAAALAQRLLKEAPIHVPGQDALETRLTYGARLVLSRDPTPQELTVLRALYEKALRTTPAAAPKATPVSNTGAKPESRSRAQELAALTAVASVLFNLDSALTR